MKVIRGNQQLALIVTYAELLIIREAVGRAVYLDIVNGSKTRYPATFAKYATSYTREEHMQDTYDPITKMCNKIEAEEK